MPDSKQRQNDNVGGFPSSNQPKSPDNETGNQTSQVEINRKTERSDRPEQS